MDLVRPGLDHLIHDAARGSPKFCIVVVRQNLKFRHRIGIWIYSNVVAQKIRIIRSIHEETSISELFI